MAKSNRTTQRVTPKQRQVIKDIVRQQAELDHFERVLSMLRASEDEPVALTRSQNLRVSDIVNRYGCSAQQVVRRAMDLWLQVEGPLYLARA